MSKPDSIIDKRMVNALLKQADFNMLGKMMLGFDGKIGLAISKKMMGGMWVGGDAYLTPETIEFHPNILNKLFHPDAEDLRVVIPLAELISTKKRFGLGTQIIDLNTQEATLSIRCLNSASFATAIGDARRKIDV